MPDLRLIQDYLGHNNTRHGGPEGCGIKNKGQLRWLSRGRPLTSDQRALVAVLRLARGSTNTTRDFGSTVARVLARSLSIASAHREFGACAVLGTEPATPVGNPEDVAAKTSMLRLMGKASASDDGSLFDA